MPKNILDGLNDDQKKAASYYTGASFILAGPGSGKTATIIRRTAYMIQQGIKPENIILFTFTNKAAKEIKNRVISFIGEEQGNKITVGTYHSVCVRFLKRYADRIGYTNQFSIFDSDDSANVVKKLCKTAPFDHKKAIGYISSCKSKGITASESVRNATGFEEKLAIIYRQYQDELHRQNSMDFDDIILNTIKLFENNPDILETINNKYTYITADEFHDSSSRDVRLIELLAGKKQNVCMILDPDQSIYGFRGANLAAVLGVDKIFPDLKTFVLRRNYRSTQTIVNAANSLIEHNSQTIDKELYSENDVGEKLLFFSEENAEQEALRCVKLIKALTSKQFGLEYSQIAILYRMTYLSRTVEEAFLKNGIPYKVVGGLPFCGRKEIKDILSFIKFANNPNDFESFKRSVGIPKRGIGEATLDKVKDYAKTAYSQPIDFIQAIKELPIKGKAKNSLTTYVELIESLKTKIDNNDSPKDVLKDLIKTINYKQIVNDAENSETIIEERLNNLKELLNIASTFDNMTDFLDSMALNIPDDESDTNNKVNLLTQHTSKGLEFEAVILLSCNEGTSPHYKAIISSDVEEERRLFYVAMTRAKKYLFLTRPKKVMKEGRLVSANESRFIKEISKTYLKRV